MLTEGAIEIAPDGSEIRVCAVCQQEYSWSPTEMAFYQRMNFVAPRRCVTCRRRRRPRWEERTEASAPAALRDGPNGR